MQMANVLFFFIYAFWTLGVDTTTIAVTEDSPTVDLQQGKVTGTILKSSHGNDFFAFLGIPYGKVPQRFTSPEPADAWDGVFNATNDGPICKQDKVWVPGGKVEGQEDCLVLNVYTPKDAKEKVPVMVFIYGGGFNIGEATSTFYGPQRIMNKDVVLVAMNYRVGPFGFLSTGDEAAPGNYGLLDQVLALKWVKNNIDAFGGDPNKVLLFGESAGAVAVTFHVLSPLSKDLFHAAIAQSGSALGAWAVMKDPLSKAKRIGEKLNCSTDDTNKLVECLRNVDADDLLKAADLTDIKGTWEISMAPVIENSKNGQFITESPLTLLREGRFNKVPVISGITSDESGFFVLMLRNTTVFDDLNDIDTNSDKWEMAIKAVLDYQVGRPFYNSEDIEKIKRKYFEGVDLKDETKFNAKLIELASDGAFKSPNDETVKLISAAGVPTYMYVLDRTPPFSHSTNYSGKPDVIHGADLGYLFNMTAFVNFTLTDSDKAFSDEFINMWRNFAASENPTPDGKPVEWTPTPPGKIKYLYIGTEFKMMDDYLKDKMDFWHDIHYKQ